MPYFLSFAGMKLVRPNYAMLILRIVLLGLCLYLSGIMFRNMITGKYENKSDIIYVGVLFFIIVTIFVAWSLFGIFRIEYSEQDRMILFKNLLGGKKEVSTSDITGYYQTSISTDWKRYPGYIFKLSDGKSIEVTEYNLRRLRNFHAFIVRSEVPCLGTKRSWFPLKRKV